MSLDDEEIHNKKMIFDPIVKKGRALEERDQYCCSLVIYAFFSNNALYPASLSFTATGLKPTTT